MFKYFISKTNFCFVYVLVSGLDGKRTIECTRLHKELRYFIVRVPPILKWEGHRYRIRSVQIFVFWHTKAVKLSLKHQLVCKQMGLYFCNHRNFLLDYPGRG
jgi:hypothetical protein